MNQAGFGPHAVGYWVVLASTGMAIIGTVVVWLSARAHAREPTTGASSMEVEGRDKRAASTPATPRPRLDWDRRLNPE
jgi:hypothetical protein